MTDFPSFNRPGPDAGLSAEPAIVNRAAPMTRARLREWVAAAQPNARLVYGHGPNAAEACSEEVRTFVFALYEKGFVTPHRIKGRGGEKAQHIVQRTARPVLKGMVL